MKKLLFFFILMLSPMLSSAQTVSDVQNSGCLNETRGEEGQSIPTIVLTKEGSTLSIQLLNYESNCCTDDFNTASSISGNSDGEPCSVSISVVPISEHACDCICPYNVLFSIRDLKPNSFYLNCWWYEGQVELTEGEPLVLEYKTEVVDKDGLRYLLLKTTHQARLLYQIQGDDKTEILQIPSEVEYEGEKYTVISISEGAFGSNNTIKKIIIPKTVKNTEFGSLEGITSHPFASCLSLEEIEVEEGNPVICSVDGVLFNKDITTLLGYPAASPRESYIVPEGVKTTANGAFVNNQRLKKIVLPSSMETLGLALFRYSNSLEEVILSLNIKELPSYLFENCINLKSIVIPEGITSIGSYAFEGCSSLESISMPESVTMVGMAAFASCTSLKSAILSTNLKEIPLALFRDCCNLAEIIIPSGITTIGDVAFGGCKAMQTFDLPESINYIGSFPFRFLSSLKDIYCHAKTVPNTDKNAFGDVDISQVTLHVPAASLSTYKAADPWKNFKEIVALEDQDDYRPFVVKGKKWRVIRSDFGGGYHNVCYRLMNEKVEKAGKTYMKMYLSEYDLTVLHDAGLLREENRKVYLFDSYMQKEFLLFDYSLKAGDTYETYSYDEQKMVSYKVLSVSNCTEGPEAILYDYDEEKDSMITHRRYLRKWTVCRTDDNSRQKTWIESVGSLEGPFANLSDERPISSMDNLAYVDDYNYYYYLPFSFHNEFSHVHGCNLPTGTEDYREDDNRHKLTYELEGDRLHIYGKAFTQCGPNNYAFFYEKKTDDPLVNKIEFVIQEVEPLADCMALHATNFYVPGFDPNMNYIVVDNRGEEHPVNNKTPQIDYRPLVEEGKVWTYHYHGLNGREFNVGRVIDCDTIIGELTYKKIYDKVGGQYQYALREEGKKIYIVYPNYETASLLYDFSKNVGDVINELAYPLIVASVDTIDIDGVKFRRMRVQDADKPVEEWRNDLINMYNFWIEGVGSESLLEASIREPGNAYNLLSCQINGRVYTQQELLGIVSKPSPQMEYRPFVEEGKVWKVGDTSVNPVQLVKYYYFDGDTIINGKVCKQMMCQVYYGPNYPDLYLIDPLPDLNYVGAWYEEDKKVYCYNSTNQLRMVYDFSLEANDTLLIDNNYHYVIGPKQTGGLEGFKGVYRDIMWLVGEGTSYCTTWLEGVGGIDGPTTNVYYGSEGRSPFLMSCTVGDEVIYFNDEYEDGATPSEVMGARKNRFDFSHTIKTKPKAPRRSEEELSLYGEYNDLKLGINLDPLDDAYQVHITDESGKIVYEKAINAGNIVGLNIDISAYEKGRYTVTVENSDESFTGEFYAQATGIEAIIYNKVETRNVIYNLQGQRLSSLQKGLNIVNGQKIYRK